MSTAASSSSGSAKGSNSGVSESVLNQLQILKILSKGPAAVESAKYIEIDEISKLSGLRDEKETQRYLFILEGQKLVSPFPEGDLTSRKWKITSSGQQAVQQFCSN